jgi:peptide/nickel transport system substrate-binding protein
LKTRKVFCCLVAFALLVVIVSGITVAANPAPKLGGTLIMGKVGEAPNLDPHMTSAIATRRVLDLVYSKLILMNEQMEVIPDLAESWEIPDAQTYVFYLRENIVFHDGSPCTSEDVKYSLERIADPLASSWGKAALNIIDTIETPDPFTVKITLKTPNAGFFGVLASDYACIVSKKVTEGHGSLRDIAVGTGPFRLERWTPGIETILVKNEHYYKEGLPYLDQIVMKIIPDELSLIAAMRTKQIDLGRLNDPRNIRLAQFPGAEIRQTTNLAYNYLGFNTRIEPLGDLRVRQAITLAIDKPEILGTVGMDYGTLLSVMPAGFVQYAVPLDQLPFTTRNVEKAKQLLEEAGYADGFELELITPLPSDFPDLAGAGIMIQSYLADVGIRVELKQLELATFLNRTDNLKDAAMFMQVNSGRADPDDQLYSVFYSSGPLNRAFLEDEETDRLLDLGRTTLDLEERIQVYKDLQFHVSETVPMVWLYSPQQLDVIQDYVKGFTQTPMYTYRYLEHVWLDK